MKNIFYLTLSFLIFFISSCTKDSANTSTSTTTSNKKIAEYAGTLVGSSGAYKLSLKENSVTCNLLFDGVKHTLTSSQGLNKGSSMTIQNGQISLNIYVDNSGNIPTLSFTIPGHTINYTILNSSLTNAARNYIGESKVTDNGVDVLKSTFNITLGVNNDFYALDKILYVDSTNGTVGGNVLGRVATVNGTYVETTTEIKFSYKDANTGQNETLIMTKNGTDLNWQDNHGGTAHAELVP